jgi:hypothetical protein
MLSTRLWHRRGALLYTLQERYQRQLRDHSWRKERRKYGRTGAGAYVEQDKLDKLCELGYDRWAVATRVLNLIASEYLLTVGLSRAFAVCKPCPLRCTSCRHVAAEALRSSGNEWSTALESLLDQNKRTALTLAASLRQVMPQVISEHRQGLFASCVTCQASLMVRPMQVSHNAAPFYTLQRRLLCMVAHAAGRAKVGQEQ